MNVSDIKECFYVPGKPGIIDVCINGKGGYSGETLDQMRLRHPSVEIGDFDTVCAQSEAMFRQPPVEITEDRYREMLEVLPPVAWTRRNGWETFKLSERTSGSITAIFAFERASDKYFELQDSITMPHDEIIAACAKPL